MADPDAYLLKPIGIVRSRLKDRHLAPSQGSEGAPEALIELATSVEEGLEGIDVGHEIIVITWFHQAERDVLKLHPRWDTRLPQTGVFNTRSPDRPNPLGLHSVTVLAVAGHQLKVAPLEAIDETPVIDIKPALRGSTDS
jgi:tRNA-Thr(GGU) m(6)t(6)A37 methyltransferase TsaA